MVQFISEDAQATSYGDAENARTYYYYTSNRFTGQQYDPLTQQYYLMARFYNPAITRFTKEDTYRGDGLNLYVYCGNNPVCFVDPSGHAYNKDPDGEQANSDNDRELMLPAVIKKLKVTLEVLQSPNDLVPQPKQLPAIIYDSPYKPRTPDADTPNSLNRTNGGDSDTKIYRTNTKTNKTTGDVYVGRTSGTGTPQENLARRDANHHMNARGFGPAVLDKTSPSYEAIIGREQMLIDYHGGAQSTGGHSGNAINGIGANNMKRDIYINAARGEFGDIE